MQQAVRQNSELIMNKITNYWKEFQKKNPEYNNVAAPQHYYFCDSQKDADECAELVVKEIKQATSTSIWWYEKYNENLPKLGDISIVTDWNGNPKAIIQTENIEIVKFENITPEYAEIEGEGDKSLEYWNRVHWEYYKREMEEFGELPSEEMEIVCEIFKTIG